MNGRRRIDRKDLFSGLATLAIGLFALIESLRMPRLEHLHINPYTVPGLVPGLIGVVLTGLGLMLTLRAIAAVRHHVVEDTDTAEESPSDPEAETRLTDVRRRVILTLGTTIVYAGLLFGRIPFVISTILFIFVFTVGAEWINRERPRSMWKTAVGALILATAVAFAVQFVFEEIFRVRLSR